MTTETRETRITVRVNKPWAAVPFCIFENKDLSPTARLILLYLLALNSRCGWVIFARQVQIALHLGQGTWQRARNELERAGFYSSSRRRGGGGRWEWEHHVSDEPGAATIGSLSADGGSTDGKCADRCTHTDQIHKKQQHARARAPTQADAGAAAAEPVEKATKETKAFRIVHGMECWTQDDPENTAALIKQHGLEAVKCAADALRGVGIAPVPSRVAKELQRRAAAAQEAKKRGCAEVRAAALQEESRRRGARELEELMALQAREAMRERDS